MRGGETFWTRLKGRQVLVADGATGTYLQSQGLGAGRAPEVWLFEQPDRIRAMHRAYIQAGADLILTCTFGGTRYRLKREGLSDKVIEVNRRAAELARQAAGDTVLVVGDMGPTGQLLKPLGTITREEVANAYAEQAAGLIEGGVDLLLLETMSDLEEVKAAIEGVRRVTDLSLICTFSFDTHGRTMMGIRPAQAAREIAPWVEGIGANCGRDPTEFPDLIQAMRQAAPGTVLWAKPNAGLPQLVGEQATYTATPTDMAQIALQLLAAGAQVIGGCCGTTPAHIAAMTAALRRKQKVESLAPETGDHTE